MPRQKNTRPTSIYWLYDTRPEMVAEFGPHGKPFYCGKAVSPKHRLSVHLCDARKNPSDFRSARILECGEHIQMRIMEIVSPEEDWAVHERLWIAIIRRLYPGGTNIRDGGQGSPGFIVPREIVEKRAAALRGRKPPPEVGAKISAALKGRVHSPEHRAKLSAVRRGKPQSPESNAKRSATLRGRPKPPGAAEKTAAALRGRKRPPHVIAKMVAGRAATLHLPLSVEHRAKIGAANKARWAERKAESARG